MEGKKDFGTNPFKTKSSVKVVDDSKRQLTVGTDER